MTTLPAKGVDDFLEVCHILYLVNEQISLSCRGRQFVDQILKLIGGLDLPVFAQVQIEIYDTGLFDSVFPKFLCNGIHQAGFSATPYARDDLDEIAVVVEPSDESEIILSLIDVHGNILSDISPWRQVKGVVFALYAKSAPLIART